MEHRVIEVLNLSGHSQNNLLTPIADLLQLFWALKCFKEKAPNLQMFAVKLPFD
jgi:hypothetical protein|tara:strand:+ start:334 stop:495 length:162 start_codon:yes stop_codon:yes gene_type:complete